MKKVLILFMAAVLISGRPAADVRAGEITEAGIHEKELSEAEPYQVMYEDFLKILADHDLIGLVYNCTEYAIKEKPDLSSATVYTLGTGHQIQFLNVVVENGQVWYQVQFAADDKVYQGFMENTSVITSDMFFTEWKEKHQVDSILTNQRLRTVRAAATNLAAFPESYRSYIQQLLNAHPNWTFVPFNTGLNWNTIIDSEMYPTRNLVPVNSMTAWKSMDPPHYNPQTGQFTAYDSGNWVQASNSIVKYYMDPRNFLNEDSVFQFELLTYSLNHTEKGVEALLKGSFMSNKKLEDGSGSGKTYGKVFMEIGSKLKVSPYFLASRVRQEQGVYGTSKLIAGTYPGFENLYNYFNMGASGGSMAEIIVNGLTEASKEGWTTRYSALSGGSAKVAEKFIRRGQDTLYLQKFDVDKSYDGLYWHQYMQNLLAADNEGKSVKKAYAGIGALNNSFVFKIPVYNNMPSSAYAMPKDTLKKPAITLKKTGSTSGTISWQEVSGAAGYQVYRADSENGSYKKIKKLEGISNTSWKLSIDPGKTYYYKVRAYRNDTVRGKYIYSPYSTKKPLVAVKKTTINGASINSKSYAVLKWKKISGVSGYRLYRSKTGKKGSFKQVKDVAGGSSITYTDKQTRPDNTYYYKLKPYITSGGKKYFGDVSAARRVDVLRTPTVTIKKTGKTSGTISWKKVSQAAGYQVYRASSANGTYKNIKKLVGNAGTSCKLAIEYGKTYYYRVRAYKNDAATGKYMYSPYSKGKPLASIKKSAIVSAGINGKGNVVLKWSKVSGVSGYRLYRSAKGAKGSFAKVKDLKGSSAVTYTDKKPRLNQAYYYKIIPYIASGGKKYLGDASAAKQVYMLKKPALAVKKTGDASVRISWNKVSGAAGYQVYRATRINGTYKNIKKLVGNSATSYKTSGRKYYYKVRAFRQDKAAGNYMYSPYSIGKSV